MPKKVSKSLKKQCKKLNVKLTLKRGEKRVTKSVTLLKKQCKKAEKRKLKRKSRRKSKIIKIQERYRSRHRRRALQMSSTPPTALSPRAGIFKKYEKEKNLDIFNNKLYFPRGTNGAIHYTRNMDIEVMKWINELLNKHIFVRSAFGNTPLEEKEIKTLLQMIMLCLREIFYDKIQENKNFVDPSMVQCMASAAVMVALKVFLEYDWSSTKLNKNFPKEMEFWTDGACSAKLLSQMEWDILKTTKFRTCYNVQKKLGHIPEFT